MQALDRRRLAGSPFAATNAVIAAVLTAGAAGFDHEFGQSSLLSAMGAAGKSPASKNCAVVKPWACRVSARLTDSMTAHPYCARKTSKAQSNVRRVRRHDGRSPTAFLHKQYRRHRDLGACASMRRNAHAGGLVRAGLSLLGSVSITVARDFHRRAPEALEAFSRAILEGSRRAPPAKDKTQQDDSKYTRSKTHEECMRRALQRFR